MEQLLTSDRLLIRLFLFVESETLFFVCPYVCTQWSALFYQQEDGPKDIERNLWASLLFRDFSNKSSVWPCISKLMERIEYEEISIGTSTRKSTMNRKHQNVTFASVYQHLVKENIIIQNLHRLANLVATKCKDILSLQSDTQCGPTLTITRNTTRHTSNLIGLMNRMKASQQLLTVLHNRANSLPTMRQRLEMFFEFITQIDNGYKVQPITTEEKELFIKDFLIIEETFRLIHFNQVIEEEDADETLTEETIERRMMQVEGSFVNWGARNIHMKFVLDYPHSEENQAEIDMDVFYDISLTQSEMRLDNLSTIIGKDLSSYSFLSNDAMEDDDSDHLLEELTRNYLVRMLVGIIAFQLIPLEEYSQLTFNRVDDLLFFLKFGSIEIMQESLPKVDLEE